MIVILTDEQIDMIKSAECIMVPEGEYYRIPWWYHPVGEEGHYNILVDRNLPESAKPLLKEFTVQQYSLENPAPCPHCGRNDSLTIKSNVSYGHGDSTCSDVRIECTSEDCKPGGNWGNTINKDQEERAWKIWNKRI